MSTISLDDEYLSNIEWKIHTIDAQDQLGISAFRGYSQNFRVLNGSNSSLVLFYKIFNMDITFLLLMNLLLLFKFPPITNYSPLSKQIEFIFVLFFGKNLCRKHGQQATKLFFTRKWQLFAFGHSLLFCWRYLGFSNLSRI